MEVVSFVDGRTQDTRARTLARHAISNKVKQFSSFNLRVALACKLRVRYSGMAQTLRQPGEDSLRPMVSPPARSSDLKTDRGTSGSPEQLFAALYRELHALAERCLRGLPFGSTLSTTTLLHEAYLSLANREDLHFPDRPRFLSYASRAMRGLIIDYTRRRSATKRGGEFQLVPLMSGTEVQPEGSNNLAELGHALDELAKLDPALAELVDVHFFCGLSFVEIATMRGVSERTVQRDWRKARVILHHQLRD